ncbi:alpha/beta hydrolase [Marinobacterium zhoushanense]|uniref:Alpha/beta hydrolase n=1 Tax=Marinobacterium zhoushanense TaxID=1679163 RepID=A0ABQ1KBR3_9GAMM|nr:alpha/beta hydrolase [Marinobacterium zhoushanense]GGB90289.1 alpha/beta hydrolase [Marinobacterium zhoushanense]
MSINELSIDIGGRRLAAIDFGGPADRTVLAVHGWLDNAASFMELAPRLEGYRVIAVDLAGHGRSDWRDQSSWYAIWDYVLDLRMVIEALSLQKVHLLGHSLGAAVASVLAAVLPERIQSLVMLEGLGPLTIEAADMPEQLQAALEWHTSAKSSSVVYQDPARMVAARMRGRFPVGEGAANHLVSRALKQVPGGYGWAHDPRLLAPSLLRFSEDQVQALFRVIEMPVLVCLAEEGIATDETRQRLNSLAQLRLLEFAGGHHPHLEPATVDLVADAVNAFYRDLHKTVFARKEALA